MRRVFPGFVEIPLFTSAAATGMAWYMYMRFSSIHTREQYHGIDSLCCFSWTTDKTYKEKEERVQRRMTISVSMNRLCSGYMGTFANLILQHSVHIAPVV